MRHGLLYTVLGLALALAQTAAAMPDCTGKSSEIPAELSAWNMRTAVAAAPAASAAPEVTLGGAADVALAKDSSIAYAAAPGKAGAADSHGGLLALDVTDAGTYQVALGGKAWVDVIRDGRAIPSTTHGHGPDCSGIAKIVDFPLEPGRYLVQIAGSASPAITLLVLRRP
ncbi:homogentisate 1,2-dioxygenase [Iodidimonas sp. SYSU 1G8]|uniref:homogentisate 1,2-dioxygenase n=1 Tax=Iodidimonas sp. SYSU 1G8 TaxID=3133967 RepID=UPI0031FF2444